MSHVDFFSRNFSQTSNTNTSVKAHSTIQTISEKRINLADLSPNWLQAEQRRDPELNDIITKIENDNLDLETRSTYEIRSNILYRKIQRNNRNIWLPIVPRGFRWSVINHIHETVMHLGWQKTLEKTFQHYWFPHMSKYVRKFVDNCITCKLSKSTSGKPQITLHPIPKTPIPWHTIHIDVTGKLSGKNNMKQYVFVIIDAFTKFVLLRHALHIDANNAINALKTCVSLFGAPSRIISDQGRCFTSGNFQNFCESHNINLHLIATGSCRANGQVERLMSTLKDMLTAVETSQNRSWQDALDDVQLAINSTVNRVTKASPLELLIGRVARPLNLMLVNDNEPEVDLDQLREQAVSLINKSAKIDKIRFDNKKAKVSKFNVGDYVLIENHERNQTKLDPKFKGPFEITEVLNGDRYRLKNLNSNRSYKYARERLRPFPTPYVPDEFNLDSTDSQGKES